MKKVSLQLEPLTCPSCIAKIESALQKQEGVQEVSVLFNASKAKVSFDEEKTDVAAISKVVTDLGFDIIGVK